MIEKQAMAQDGKSWNFTLRPDLKFSNGTPVFGNVLKSAGAAWKAADDRRFILTLNEPVTLLLEVLSKPSSFPLLVLPERLARMPTTAPISEVLAGPTHLQA